MSGSTVPGVLSALWTLWANAGIADLQVVDGPIFDPEIDFLAVGWDRSDEPGVTASSVNEDLGGQGTYETFDVSNLLSMWLGNSDLPTVRAALFDAFTTLKTVLLDEPTLGGVVDNSWITAYEYTPTANETGDQVDLRFTVHFEAYPA